MLVLKGDRVNMAKYIGSPWGIIIGKVGPTVGYRWRGMNLLRAKGKSENKGSYYLLERARRGKVPKSEVSVRLANVVVLRWSVMWLCKISFRNLIYPVWQPLSRNPLDGRSLFFKRNFAPLYRSIPFRDEFIGPSNLPDFRVINLTEGVLEESRIKDARYEEGKVIVEWESACYRNGSREDSVHIFAIYIDLSIPHTEWGPMALYGRIKFFGDARVRIGGRGSGWGEIEVGDNLGKGILVGYLSFSNKKLGYSRSVAAEVYRKLGD